MTSPLTSLPYEVLAYVLEYISIRDVVSLSLASKQLRFLIRKDDICKRVLKAEIPFCDETVSAERAGKGYAFALRRIAKRYEAIAQANPFSIAIVGLGDDFLYINGTLSYILDDSLRILDLHASSGSEVVVSIPELLRQFLYPSEQEDPGRFRVLYCNAGIISCLYSSTSSDPVSYLIAFNFLEARILLTCTLPYTDKIFVRHTSTYLYYGTFSQEDDRGHRKWLLRGYSFENSSWLEQRVFFGELNGSEIGSTICFEIFDGVFYALSNQTNHDVEEVDWTSFYHAVRFPVASPSKTSLEKTALDEHMWRRQHREGPLDDRWGTLALRKDQVTGDLKIVETRKEFLRGATRSQRTNYTTKLVFPPKKTGLNLNLTQSAGNAAAISADASSSTPGASDEPSWGSRRFEKYALAAMTNDRLALTLKATDNPHWLPAQKRYPRNVHTGQDGNYILSQTHWRSYNCASNTFVDFIDDPHPQDPSKQRLRIRAGSRVLDPPARGSQGFIAPDHLDLLTGEPLYGLNETYTPQPVAFWPPDPTPHDKGSWGLADKRQELDNLMNPPSHTGNVEVMGDDRSFVYATGGKQSPSALIFVNFDPAIRLRNLKKWDHGRVVSFMGDVQNGQDMTLDEPLEANSFRGEEEMAWERPTGDEEWRAGAIDTQTRDSRYDHFNNALQGPEEWIRKEPAMYIAIDRGFDFGREDVTG